MIPENWHSLAENISSLRYGVDTAADTMGLAAAAYAKAGIEVFPLHWVKHSLRSPSMITCSCSHGLPNCKSPGKHPLTPDGLLAATCNMTKIAKWWGTWPQANIGIPTNHNRLAVIDVDTYHDGEKSFTTLENWAANRGADIGQTMTVRTPSGGSHYYYQAPPGGIKTAVRTFGANGVGLDTRGVGGYVVAPPSKGLNGRYEFIIGSGNPAPWPECLSHAITMAYPERNGISPLAAGQPLPQAPPTGDRGARWGLAALLAECDEISQTLEGGRNARLNAGAYKMGRIVAGGNMDAQYAARELAAAGLACGLPQDEVARTVTSGMLAGQKNPRYPAAAQPI